MAERQPKFVPLPDVESETVRILDNLPEFVDREQIGVNVRGIERLCRVGGIRSLTLVGKWDGDTTTYTPTIVGVNKNGEGVAGKTGAARKADMFSSNSEYDRLASR